VDPPGKIQRNSSNPKTTLDSRFSPCDL